MNAKAMVPFIDIVFLTLGSLLGVMIEMRRVDALNIDISEVGRGGSVVTSRETRIVALTADGLHLDGTLVTPDILDEQLGGANVVLRADRTLSTETTLDTLATLSDVCAAVAVEVSHNAAPEEP